MKKNKILCNDVLQNFPFLEDDFDALTDYQLFCKGFGYLDKEKADKKEIPDVSNFITKDVDNLTNYYDKDTTDDLLDNKADVTDIPDVSDFITKDVDDLTNYYDKDTTDDLLDNKANTTDIPDVSDFITKDVDNLTNYYDKDTTDDLLDAKENLIEKGSNTNGHYLKFDDGTMICYNSLTITGFAIATAYGSLYQNSTYIDFPVSFIESPVASCTMLQYGGGASWGTVRETSTTQVRIRAFDAMSRDGSLDTKISWIAIGKWK